jgi:hypothetical protein
MYSKYISNALPMSTEKNEAATQKQTFPSGSHFKNSVGHVGTIRQLMSRN